MRRRVVVSALIGLSILSLAALALVGELGRPAGLERALQRTLELSVTPGDCGSRINAAAVRAALEQTFAQEQTRWPGAQTAAVQVQREGAVRWRAQAIWRYRSAWGAEHTREWRGMAVGSRR